MRPRRPRASATPSSVDDVHNDADISDARRQPFRPLQPLRTSRSPATPILPTKSTPPREIILTPRATPKPIKRKASSRLKRRATKVKSEPPEFDLSKLRPPSPSDDPLLLSGTRSARSPPLRGCLTPPFSSSPSDSKCIDPPVTFKARLSGRRFGALSSPDIGHALPMFNAPRGVEEMSGVWSDSDDNDDELNLTGEYTGKYKILKVPTKADPPTNERMGSWGRPLSPFPYSEIMERSLPPDDFVEDGGRRDDIDILDSIMPSEDPSMWEVATEPPPSDVEPSPPPSISEDEFADLDDDFLMFDVDAESTQVRPLVEPREVPGSDQTILEEQEEEAQIDRELSIPIDDGFNFPFTLSRAEQSFNLLDDDFLNEGDDVEGDDIIKITSEDPKAAARAAAILRMHDYDCVFAAERKKLTRDCWKCLDKCLVAERLAVAAARGFGTDILADMGDISKDAVVDRFVNQLGGESVLAGLGHDWSRDNLILRLDVLIKKQQSRQAIRAPMFARRDSLGATEPRYRGLLQEAMALSGTIERCTTSGSTGSDSTVVSERYDARKMRLLDLFSCPEPSWQTSHLCRPIRTPSRTPDPRPLHPKDQIHLRHASLPQKSMIPVPIRPKRLIDLRHLSPAKGDRGGWRPTARRSSGCSVKDLVRQFESLDK